jgi:hypothetical protein
MTCNLYTLPSTVNGGLHDVKIILIAEGMVGIYLMKKFPVFFLDLEVHYRDPGALHRFL